MRLKGARRNGQTTHLGSRFVHIACRDNRDRIPPPRVPLEGGDRWYAGEMFSLLLHVGGLVSASPQTELRSGFCRPRGLVQGVAEQQKSKKQTDKKGERKKRKRTSGPHHLMMETRSAAARRPAESRMSLAVFYPLGGTPLGGPHERLRLPRGRGRPSTGRSDPATHPRMAGYTF